MTGILAVWNDRGEAIADKYERWYMTEHVPERLAVPGFRSARRYQAVAGDRSYFTFYELDSPAVLDSPAYTACLENPSVLTRTIMPQFLGMIRSVFVEQKREGVGIGGSAVVLRFSGGAPAEAPRFHAHGVDPSEIVATRIWAAPPGAAPIVTVESRTRPQPDEIARGAIVFETTNDAVAESVEAALAEQVAPTEVAIGRYRLLCAFAR
jgi:hypothetical protein